MNLKTQGRIAALLASLSLLLATEANARLPADSDASSRGPEHVPGQLLVQYKSGFSDDFIEARLVNMGLNRLDRYQALNTDLVAVPVGFDLERFAQEIRRESMVSLVEPNYIYRKELRPDDTRFSLQWQLENNGANYVGNNGAGLPGADLNLVPAWDIQAFGAGSIIAIIDDAVETSHEDLAPNILAGGKCFESGGSYCGGNPNNPNPTGADQDHGTWVAGSAAARGDNTIGVASPAWRASILPYKTDLTSAAITASINDAVTKGAHIINMSFGGPTPSASTRAALATAQANGILAIASAGNGDANNDRSKAHFPSNYDLPNVFSIASSDGYDDISGFSQWGAFTVELAAPGSLVQTTSTGDSYVAVSGTSFASPLVAGVAALIKAETGASGPNAWKQLRAHLLYGGVNGVGLGGTQTPGRDRKAIPGRVQAGRLDAARALQGPPGGVIVINGFTVDDSATGNNNGLLDPNESADLIIEVENVWTTESNVTGTLLPFDSATIPSAFESGQLSATAPTQSFGTIAQDQKVTARFPVTLGNVTQNEQYFLTLQLASDNGTLPDRYFTMEIGELQNNVTVTQAIQRLNFDEFHAWHVDVPPGASNLVIATTADNPTGGTCSDGGQSNPASIDIDLLARFGQPPEYSIALAPPEGSESFYTDPATRVSGNCGGHETLIYPTPQAGTYHIVVVNFDQVQHDYTITASFDAPQEGTIVFDPPDYLIDENAGTVVMSVSRTGGSGVVSVDYATRDGSAAAGSDYASATGTLSWADGETGSKTLSVNLIDDAAFEADEQFFVDLQNPTGGASIGSQATGNVTIIDDDNPGELGFTSSTYSAVENGLVATIGVTRSNGNKGVLAVDYASADGSATAGSDYQAASGTLLWADGEAGEKTFQVQILEDAVLEADETVLLSISNPVPTVPLTPTSSVLTIDDNDDPGSVSFDQASFLVDETAGSVQISVTRSGGDLAGSASIDYATADQTATAGSDYQAASGTFSWLPGEGGSKTVTINISDDTAFEPDEIFTFTLSNPSSGLTIAGSSSATVTITDDDDPGQLQFSAATQSIGEAGGTVTVTVNRIGGFKGAVDVSYETATGTATGSDFTAANGTLSWTDGDSGSRTVDITINNDTLNENGESFTVTLSAPTNGARLGSPATITITIIDNDQPAGGGGGGGGGSMGWLGIALMVVGVARRRRRPFS